VPDDFYWNPTNLLNHNRMSRTETSLNPMDSHSTVLNLNEIRASVDFTQVQSSLTPPPRFETATLESYISDENFPSQDRAKHILSAFIRSLNEESSGGFQKIFSLFSSKPQAQGIYLDGGFGVGKTHLLASVFHGVTAEKKIYLSFTELMYFIGLAGLERCAAELGAYKLICIDEFELDDPGNTTMSLGFLTRIIEKNVRVVATSNTPPERLGEGRFAVQDFQREIGEIASRFQTVQIDGNDYRRRKHADGTSAIASLWQLPDLQQRFTDYAATTEHKKLFLSEPELLAMLRRFHPMHYFELAEKLDAVFLDHLSTLRDQYDALRFVYFIDKLYDDKVKIFAAAHVSIEEIFPPEFYKTAYAKKYWRCVSRLKEVTAD
jgi:cell division protein ZapE